MATFVISILWSLYILDCLLLIGIILLQPGEGGDIAAAFGGASSQTAFGARGSATFIQKLTTGFAVAFMLLSIVLVIVTNLRQQNIMEKYKPEATQKKAAPAQPAPAPPPQPTQAPPAQPAPAPAPTPVQPAPGK